VASYPKYTDIIGKQKGILDDVLAYPWRSKANKSPKAHPDTSYEITPRQKVISKPIQRGQFRPTFSKQFGTREIDYVLNLTSLMNDENDSDIDLLCINVNSGY
jgi:hypothetical protein